MARELTEKELKRKDCFETLSSEMQQKGYKIKKVVRRICLYVPALY